jgi:hypothetical protein
MILTLHFGLCGWIGRCFGVHVSHVHHLQSCSEIDLLTYTLWNYMRSSQACALAQCRGPSASPEVRNSLSSCTQLIHLSLRNCSIIVNDFLLQHVGALLKKLCMHEDERWYRPKQRNAITQPQIFAISKYCSKLSHLEIDVDYESGGVSQS